MSLRRLVIKATLLVGLLSCLLSRGPGDDSLFVLIGAKPAGMFANGLDLETPPAVWEPRIPLFEAGFGSSFAMKSGKLDPFCFTEEPAPESLC